MANVITIDGPAGSGKSTICRLLANRLGYSSLDSGILFRAVAYIAIQNNYSSKIHEDILKLSNDLNQGKIKLVVIDNECQIEIDGKILTSELKTEEVSKGSAEYSPFIEIRESIKNIQKITSENHNMVIAGRDIGTEIFPDSKVKFFINVSTLERAKRRVAQQMKMGKVVDFEKVLLGLQNRDTMDINRKHGKMFTTKDSIIIDNSKPIEEVLDTCEKYVKERLPIL